MSGIAVVIDDRLRSGSKFDGDREKGQDAINDIVEWFEREWGIPFVKAPSLPEEAQWQNLLQATSFVLLDWNLWGNAGESVERNIIANIKRFLKWRQKEPRAGVYILRIVARRMSRTKLPPDVYEDPDSGLSFVFVGHKADLWSGGRVAVEMLERWVYGNASVYALRTWNRMLVSAKSELFGGMCDRSVNWPRVFWNTYVVDGAEPSASLTNLINDSLRGRMQVDAFENEHLGGEFGDVSGNELRRLIAETSVRRKEFLPEDEIRCGDLYKYRGKYWLNLRPDCDCIPRSGREADDIEVYCIEGNKGSAETLWDRFDEGYGHFVDRASESMAFAIIEGTSVVFNFKKLRVLRFREVKEKRKGRLLHPYLTRVQQRYCLYLQRQGLPRIPNSAMPPRPEQESSESSA